MVSGIVAQRELIALNHALCDAADELESTVNGEQGVAAMVQSRDDLAAKVGTGAGLHSLYDASRPHRTVCLGALR